MGVVERRTVVTDTGTDATRYGRQTVRRWALDASDVISLLAGLAFTIMGILALIDLGFDEFPSEVTTTVFGLTHTQIWGVADIVLGLLLIAGCGSIGRSVTTFAGALTLVVGVIVVAAFDELDPTLATDRDYGWMALLIGALVLIAAIAVPSVAARHDRVVDEG